ncbi:MULTISPECIES: hypothetical protein [unclassified Nocardioides]|uniref:hypothetical protein n=1 Tax=unclassified Nocardioides TaxID=2615069 RepID=UPI0006FB3DFC|nr:MULTISPECIES: hypothetical protein [unclassified Nocardioides]KQY62656.1 hypothetical protein ASD30_23370 [Nocardioides sp. Root140]KQZ75942.1 hypothetical protein ASD66_06495 [Nocardioides sp. Root151]
MDFRRRGLSLLLVGALGLALSSCSDDGDASSESPTGSARASSTPPPDAVRTEDLPATTAPTENLVPSDLASIVDDYNAKAKRRLDHLRGADVSWPQCPEGVGIPEKRGQGQPMPLETAQFVIIGLTNSPSFTRNPCLADQVAWVRDRKLLAAAYAIVSYPDAATLEKLSDEGPYDGSTRLGALKNVGYQSALFNLVTMSDAGLESPIVWLDVEPVPLFEWSNDKQANAAVVEGAVRGYGDRGVRVGFYSLPSMWSRIVGDLAFDAPEWRPAGITSESAARARCGAEWSFQGGDAVFGQWVQDSRDVNVTCPGVRLQPDRWFHKF